MSLTSLMLIVGLLENISASKSVAKKKAKDLKDAVQKVGLVYFIPYHADISLNPES